MVVSLRKVIDIHKTQAADTPSVTISASGGAIEKKALWFLGVNSPIPYLYIHYSGPLLVLMLTMDNMSSI